MSRSLTNTTYTLALVITFLYWIFVFPQLDAKEPADAYLNAAVHSFQVNMILIAESRQTRAVNLRPARYAEAVDEFGDEEEFEEDCDG